MSSENQQPIEMDFEKQVERAKWFKQNLDEGKGWKERSHVPNTYTAWSKTFTDYEAEVPVKVLYRLENLPISAAKFAEMMHPKNLDTRNKWDDTTAGLDTLEILPDGSRIVYTRIELSWPLRSRDEVLKFSPPREIDWFGRKAYAEFVVNATHPSKPAGIDGYVRATNGGNFYIAVQDEKEPESKCEVLGLTNNNYNGCLPTRNEALVGRKAVKAFYGLRQNLIDGQKEYFS